MLNYQIQLDLSDKKIRSQFQSLLGDFVKEAKNESISIQMNWDSKSINELYKRANEIAEKFPEIGIPFKFELSKKMLAEMKAEYNHIFDMEDPKSAERAAGIIKELVKEYSDINKQIEEAKSAKKLDLIPQETIQRAGALEKELMRMQDTLLELKNGEGVFAKLPKQVQNTLNKVFNSKDWEFNPYDIIINDDKRAYPKKIAELNELREMIKTVETEMANLNDAPELNVGSKVEKSVKKSKAKDEIADIKQALIELKQASDNDINLKVTIDNALESIKKIQRALGDIPNPKEIQVKVVKSEDFDQQLQNIQNIINTSVGQIDLKFNGISGSGNRTSASQDDNFFFIDQQIENKKKKIRSLVETIDKETKQLKDKNPVYTDEAKLYLETNKQINIQKKSTEDLNKIYEKQLSIYKEMTSARRNAKEIEHKTSNGDTITGLPTVESIEAQRNRIAAVISLLKEREKTDPTKALEAMSKKDQKTIENALKAYEASKSAAKSAETFAKETVDKLNQNPRKLINNAKSNIETILQQTNGKLFDRNGISSLIESLQSGKMTVDQVTESLQNMMAVASTGTTTPVQSQNILQNEIKETQEQTEQTAQVVDSTSQTLVQDFEQVAEASEDTTKAVEQTVSTLKEYAKLRAEAGTLKNPLDAGFSNYTGQSRTGTYTQLKILSESQKEGELDNAKLANEILEKAGLFTTTGDLKLIHEMEELVDQLSGGGRKLEGIKSRTKKILEDNLNSLREQFEKGAEEAIEEVSTKKNTWTKTIQVSRKKFKEIWLEQNPYLSDPDSIKQNLKRAIEEKEKAGKAYTLPPTGRSKKGKYVIEVEVELTNEEKLEKQLQIIKDKWQSGELSKQQVGYLYSKYVENGGQEKLSSIATNKKEAADLISVYKEVEKAIQAKRQAEEQALQTSQQIANAYDNEEDEILAAQRAYDQMVQEIGTVSGVQDEVQREFDETSQKISNIVPSGSLSSWEQLINLLKRLTDQINAYLVAQGIIPEEIKAVDVSQDGVQKELEETAEEAKKATYSLEELDNMFELLKKSFASGNISKQQYLEQFHNYREKYSGTRGLVELATDKYNLKNIFKDYEKQYGKVPLDQFEFILGDKSKIADVAKAVSDSQNTVQKELQETSQAEEKVKYTTEQLEQGFDILVKHAQAGADSIKRLVENFIEYRKYGGTRGLIELASPEKNNVQEFIDEYQKQTQASVKDISSVLGNTDKYINARTEIQRLEQEKQRVKELNDEFEILLKNKEEYDKKTLIAEYIDYEQKGGTRDFRELASETHSKKALLDEYAQQKLILQEAEKINIEETKRPKLIAYNNEQLKEQYALLIKNKNEYDKETLVSKYIDYERRGGQGPLSGLGSKKNNKNVLQKEYDRQIAELQQKAQENPIEIPVSIADKVSENDLDSLLPLKNAEEEVVEEAEKVVESQNEVQQELKETAQVSEESSKFTKKLTKDYESLTAEFEKRKAKEAENVNVEKQMAQQIQETAKEQNELQSELDETSEALKRIAENAENADAKFDELVSRRNELSGETLVKQFMAYEEAGGTRKLDELKSRKNPLKTLQRIYNEEIQKKATEATTSTPVEVNVTPTITDPQAFINKLNEILATAPPAQIKAELDIDPEKLKSLTTILSKLKFDGSGIKDLGKALKTLTNKNEKLEDAATALKAIHEALNKKLTKTSLGRVLSDIGGQSEGLKALIVLMRDYEKALETIKKAEDQLTDSEEKQTDAAQKKLDKLNEINQKNLDRIQESLKKMSDSGQSSYNAEAYSQLVERFNSLSQSIQTLPAEEAKSKIETLTNSVKKLKEELNQIADPVKVEALKTRIETFITFGKKLSANSKGEAKGILDNLVPGKTTRGELSQFIAQFSALYNKAKMAGELGLTFGDRWKRGLAGLARYLTTFASFYRIVGYLRQSISTIQELDDALIDLKKTTQMTTDELEQFYFNSSDIAKQTGVTTKEIIDQAAAWSRLGYSSKDASEQMAALSSQFAQISPGMTVDKATDGLVSSMKAFHIEVGDVEREIMDNVNRIGNTMATTNEEIVDMLTRSSAAMNAANNSIEETIALESAAVQITRNAETTGTAFRTENCPYVQQCA